MTALRLLPPLAWTVLIAWFSTESWSAAETGRSLLPLLHRLLPWAAPEQLDAVHWLVRKSAHVTEYGVLAVLWRRALDGRGGWRSLIAPLALSALTGALDELHQSTTLTRGASPADVLLDSAGAGAALILLSGDVHLAISFLTGVLLWIAAAGGTALIALDWTEGAPAGWLWWSVPAAWLALVCWLYRARS